MFEFVRKHGFLFAIGILLWQGGSRSAAATAPAANGEEPPPPPQRIEPADVPLRDGAAAPLRPNDPFYLLALLQRHAAEEAERAQPVEDAGAGVDGVEVDGGPGAPVLRVTLQSTMPGAPGRAWVNGADVEVGAIIPGADAEHPPVLLAVDGTGVLVAWRGKRFRIDLDGTAPIEEEGR